MSILTKSILAKSILAKSILTGSMLTKSATALIVILIAAYGIGQFTSKSISTEIDIAAPAGAVWDELADVDGHADWNPLLKHMSGDLSVGSRLVVTIQSGGNAPMTFTPIVLVSDEARELRWLGRLGFRGIFDGEHYFILEQVSADTTRLRHGETFSGMLAHVLFLLIGEDTETGFKAMNAALKARVESAG